jgi:hypothetical protein
MSTLRLRIAAPALALLAGIAFTAASAQAEGYSYSQPGTTYHYGQPGMGGPGAGIYYDQPPAYRYLPDSMDGSLNPGMLGDNLGPGELNENPYRAKPTF